jgi:hypothetical protein
MTVFWDVELCSPVEIDRRFSGAYCLHHLVLMALMKEPVNTSETSVNFYQTTRPNNPEESHLYTRRRENLKSHLERVSSKYIFLSGCIKIRRLVQKLLGEQPRGQTN